MPESQAAARGARDVLILRTQRADAELRDLITCYSGLPGLDLVVAADERSGPLDLPRGVARVSLTDATVAALGLEAVPNWAWSCGDYALYAVRRAWPGRRFYWLIEPDVRINTAGPAAFFERFAQAQQDFLTTFLSRQGPNWTPGRLIAGHYPEVWGCLFALSRLSGRALDHLHAERVALGRKLRAEAAARADGKPFRWPNDESFVASALVAAGFACADLSAVAPDLYRTVAGWSYRFPVHADAALFARPDGRVYHPVVADPESFGARLFRLIDRHPRDLPGSLDRLGWSLATVPLRPGRSLPEPDPGADLVLSVLLHAARNPQVAPQIATLARRLLPQAEPDRAPLLHVPAGAPEAAALPAEHFAHGRLTLQGPHPTYPAIIFAWQNDVGPDLPARTLVPTSRMAEVFPDAARSP